MATITKHVLGNYAGKVGNLVSYQRNGQQILAKLPDDYETKSQLVKEGRRKFGDVNKFVIPVYKKNKLIAAAWKKANPQNPWYFQKMVGDNTKFFRDNHPTKNNLITPPCDEIPFSGILYEEGKIRINLTETFPGTLLVFMVPYNPLHQDTPGFMVLTFEDRQVTGTEFIIELLASQKTSLSLYSEYIIYAAIVSENNWTNTFAVEGRIPKE